MITFREIDKSNYMECICLKVKDEQRGFVADNARSLAEARFEEGLYTPVSYTHLSFRLPPKEPTAVRQQLTTYTSFIAVNLQIVISFSPHTEKYPSGLIIPLRF